MAKCLDEDEKLAVCFQGYPALYNDTESSFHNKNDKQNAWAKIAHELQLDSRRKENWHSLHSN